MEQQSNFKHSRVRGSEKADKGDATALDSRSSEMELEVHREQWAYCWGFLNISATFMLSSEGGVKTGDLSQFNACVCVCHCHSYVAGPEGQTAMWTMLRKYRRGLAEICVLFSMADSCDVDNQDSPQHVRSRETGTGFE